MSKLKGFTPSMAGVWTQCPASVQLWQDYLYLYEKSDAAKEGIAAHKVAQRLFNKEEVKEGDEIDGVIVTKEMLDAVEIYLAYLSSDAKLEQEISLNPVFGIPSKGYVDAYFESNNGTHLHVIDFKYGHRSVDAFENKQLLVEAACLLQDHHEFIRLAIVQPRVYRQGGPLDDWELSRDELIGYINNEIKPAVKAALKDNPEANTGSHCLFCPARQACKVLREASLRAIDVTAQGSTLDLKPEELGRELQLLHDAQERLKARITGLEQQAVLALEQGHTIHGYELQPALGRLTWSVPTNEVIKLGDLLGFDLRQEPKPITPTQAKKLGMDERAINSIAERPNLGSKLKRINFNKMKRSFKK